MRYLIDTLTPFHPRKDWVAFLAEVEALLKSDPGSADLRREVSDARKFMRDQGWLD